VTAGEGAATPDPRPRPQYGEYATPEEQRAHIRQPQASRAIETGQSPDAVAPAAAPTSVSPASVRPAGAPSRGRMIDRVVTVALLIYGLLNVTLSAPRMFALADGADGYLGLLGFDEPLADTAGARLWGAVAGIVFIAGWLLTAWVSWRMLRRGRITFWVPLVGAVVFSGLAAAFIMVPTLSDPAFLEFARDLAGMNP
jgi:hypothetical protein